MIIERGRISPALVSWPDKGNMQKCVWSLEGMMLKLKLQYFSHLMRRADSFEKILMLGRKIEGRRRRG